MPPKAPTEIDRLVGSRVRQRRMQTGMSQEALAEALGVTVQQLHKYEKGQNRIGASRLHAIAGLLGAPISFFFAAHPDQTQSDPSLFADPAVIELALAFNHISSPQVRRTLLDHARALARQNTGSGADPANDD